METMKILTHVNELSALKPEMKPIESAPEEDTTKGSLEGEMKILPKSGLSLDEMPVITSK